MNPPPFGVQEDAPAGHTSQGGTVLDSNERTSGSGPKAQLVRALSSDTGVVVSIPGQGTHKNQPVNA